MKMCIAKKEINGHTHKCPLIEDCARAKIENVTKDLFVVMPYDFEDNYCQHFFWVGYKNK